ncbi:magnesium transporter NIPA-domain-containing protein [Radiomyces spectabilis]|uniref:magnesium transporter NIPA-domain-containing protein n=1 Tax=Radiomyces spectabilis TaxID=64574 RepID=UPI00221F05E1|nr:magnesium transporter NIPA-domain-containing protein [Radiomyces spectabilis]KAI8376302.1 magnesium transporter NIPA-domain-containing protein [Radiomyces spectabilis]
MSDSNSTSNPFGGNPSEAQGGLYKAIGVTLAVASGLFIGSSFVFKKKGLLQSIERSGGIAGEGYSYLKSAMWWLGMILMVVGELCNFVAYAFTQAILITPLGALSVVISAILSSIFLKEKLNFQGKVGCLQCIVGAVVIVLHAPEQSASDTSIDTFQHLVLSVGFLVYAGIVTLISLALVLYCGPRWGKTNMLVYISICSLIGSLSVVFTQGLGSAIVHSITISNQFTHWFIYLVIAIVVVTLIIEIVYLNKALNLFNTALVTPTYYVIFTTLTIVSASVLYQGFDASGADIATCVLGFISICSGIALLHQSKSAPPSNENVSLGKKKSILRMFDVEKQVTPLDEKTEIEDEGIGIDKPGLAELFPAPFTGIGRYASTTKNRSRTMSGCLPTRSRTSPLDDFTTPHSDTPDTDFYNAEENVKESLTLAQPSSPSSLEPLTVPKSRQDADHRAFSSSKSYSQPLLQYESGTFGRQVTDTSPNTPVTDGHRPKPSNSYSRRTQHDLSLFSSYRMGLMDEDADDKESLVKHA